MVLNSISIEDKHLKLLYIGILGDKHWWYIENEVLL